jgi:hypothetical protein
MGKYLIILITLLIWQCSNKQYHAYPISTFSIDVFNPNEHYIPYFKIIYENQKIYIQDSYNIESVKELKISEELKNELLIYVVNIDELLIPDNKEITGDNFVTEKVSVTFKIKNQKKIDTIYELDALRCFDGYSKELYDFYLLLRNLASLSESKCAR